MNRLSLLVLSLFSILVVTPVRAFDEDANRQVIQELCGQNYNSNKSGSGVVVGDWTKSGSQYCIKVQCDEKRDDGNWSKVSRTKCISETEYKRLITGVINGTGGIDVNGDGKIDQNDDINGDGVIDGRDLDEWRRRNGGATSGNSSGANGGSNSGANGGVGSGGIQCEYVVSGVITSSHPCAKKCRKNFWGKEGIERKACRECIEQYSVENGGDLEVDWVKIGKPRPNKSSVKINGVGTRTGQIICYDASGRVVSASTVNNIGTCPSGTTSTFPTGNGNQGTGATGTGVTGTVVVNGNTVALPSFCQSGKRRDKKKCDAWLSANARFACSSGSNPERCPVDYRGISSRYDTDCPECQSRGRRGGGFMSGLAEFVAAGAPIAGAYFGYKSNKEWANAAEAGFEQCRLAQGDYRQYLSSNELPALTPEQQAQLGCNGFGLGGFAGLGGAYGGLYGAGYTPGFLGGMMGPYGGYNPYGYGGAIGGAVGGIVAGINGGFGYAAGINGGFANGGYLAGGMAAGYPAGINGGLVNGGYLAAGVAAGYPAGYAAGINGGGLVNGGYMAAGVAAGYPAGFNGGFGYAGGINGGGLVNGGYMAAGVAAGYPAGFNGGFGYAGGINGGGLVNGGYIAAGVNGGFPGGYGGGFGGQWGSGVNTGYNPYYGANGNYYGGMGGTGNFGASSYDQMLQNQGGMYQMGMNSGLGGGLGGGYNAGMYPMNMGASLGFNFGGGLYGR